MRTLPMLYSKELNAPFLKRFLWYGVTAIGVSVAAAVPGQNPISATSSSSSTYIPSTQLIGRKVRLSEGKEIGVIKDVVIDRDNGCMAYTVISIGGAGRGLTSGEGKIIAVPWAVYSPASDLNVLTVNVSREKIYNAPTFDYSRMDEYARPDYMDNVYKYYGVNPGPPTALASSNEPVGSDATGTAGATASPGEVASPAAVAAGTSVPNTEPSAPEHGASTESRSGTSSENASPKTRRKRRASETGSTMLRREISPTAADEIASESTTDSGEKQKQRRKGIKHTSAATPSETLQSASEQD